MRPVRNLAHRLAGGLRYAAAPSAALLLGGLVFAAAPATADAHPSGGPAPALSVQDTVDAAADTAETDEGLPLEPGRRLTTTLSEGTWISVDVSPDGRTVILDYLGDLYLLPIDGGRAERLTEGMAHDRQPRFSPDGERVVFVSDRSGGENVWIISVDRTDTTQVTQGNENQYLSPEWSPDGDYVVAAKGGRNLKLWLYHVEGGTGTALVSEPENLKITGPAFGPDARWVWYAQRQGGWEYNADFPQYQIARYDRRDGESTVVTSNYGSAFRPTLSPDGRWLAYGTRWGAETGLRIRDLETGEERWLAHPVQRDEQESIASLDVYPGFSFTPDSREVVVFYGGGLWRVPVDGSGQTRIPFTVDVDLPLGPEVRFDYPVETSETFTVRQIRDAVPSPSGDRIAFTALNELYVMDWPEGEPRRLAADMEDNQYDPAWSPDGRSVAFVTWDDAGGGHVWKTRADGRGGAERLTRIPAFYRALAWSPDGDRLVAIRGAARDVQMNRGGFGGGLATVFVRIPADGGEATEIAPTAGRDEPHFGSEPDRIYASGGRGTLVSFRWDGTDEREHVRVVGQGAPGSDEPMSASTVLAAPEGERALAQVGYQLYAVTVPQVGGDTPTINVSNPERAAFPVRQLTEIGAQFPTWAADGNTVHWSLGNAHFVYDLVRARAVDDSLAAVRRAEAAADEEDDDEDAGGDDGDEVADAADADGDGEDEPGYRPVERRVALTAERDIPRGTVVLRGGRILTMEGDEIIEDGDVVVTDNRIAAVGPRGSVDVPSDARVIDVSGTTVIPGFVDTHYHTQWLIPEIHSNQVWQYLTNLAYGVTTTQDVQTSTTDILTYHDRVETGDMIGPRIYHTGPGVFSSLNIRDLDHARDVLRRYSDYYGVNTFKMYMAGNRQQRQWLIMAARELELMPTTEGGLDFALNMTHAIDGYPGLEHSLPITPLYEDVRQLFVTTQMTYTPTLLVSYGGPWAENYFYATEDVLGDEKLIRLTPMNELLAKASRRGGGGGAGWFRYEEHVFPRHAEFVRDLVEGGGRAGVGAHGQIHGVGYHWELWAMQSGGMDEHAALRVATRLGAEAIGFGDELGTVTEGKLADLVILGADPLTDLRNTTSIRFVMKNGRLYEGETLDEVWPRERPLPNYFWQAQDPDVQAGIPAAEGSR